MNPIAVSVVDAAAMIGISRAKFYQLIRNGDVPVFKIDRRTLVDTADLRRFVDRIKAAA